MARIRNQVEIASDIGAKAFDLYAYGDREAVKALAVVSQVNPEMIAWLRDRLLELPAYRQRDTRRRAGQ